MKSTTDSMSDLEDKLDDGLGGLGLEPFDSDLLAAVGAASVLALRAGCDIGPRLVTYRSESSSRTASMSMPSD